MADVFAVDWEDPCAKAKVLRDAYYQALAGREVSVRYKNGEDERELRFDTKNLPVLQRELRMAEAECPEIAQNLNRRRFAIGTSARAFRGVY